jgi:hypothetical protein
LKEIKSRYTSYDEKYAYIKDIKKLAGSPEVQHDAFLQDLLERRWDSILKGDFDGARALKDRARIGVYYLLDWIKNGHQVFNKDDLVDFLHNNTSFKISDNFLITNRVMFRLLKVLEEEYYLREIENGYEVIDKFEREEFLRKELSIRGTKNKKNNRSKSTKPKTQSESTTKRATPSPPEATGLSALQEADATKLTQNLYTTPINQPTDLENNFINDILKDYDLEHSATVVSDNPANVINQEFGTKIWQVSLLPKEIDLLVSILSSNDSFMSNPRQFIMSIGVPNKTVQSWKLDESTPYSLANSVILKLISFGRLSTTPKRHTLGLLIDILQDQVGFDQNQELANLKERYNF